MISNWLTIWTNFFQIMSQFWNFIATFGNGIVLGVMILGLIALLIAKIMRPKEQ